MNTILLENLQAQITFWTNFAVQSVMPKQCVLAFQNFPTFNTFMSWFLIIIVINTMFTNVLQCGWWQCQLSNNIAIAWYIFIHFYHIYCMCCCVIMFSILNCNVKVWWRYIIAKWCNMVSCVWQRQVMSFLEYFRYNNCGGSSSWSITSNRSSCAVPVEERWNVTLLL